MQSRYHITFKNRRTTVTLDTVLSQLLAFKLKSHPSADDVHSIVRQWLQEQAEEVLGHNVPSNSRVSQHLRQAAIEYIADKKLMNAVIDYRLE